MTDEFAEATSPARQLLEEARDDLGIDDCVLWLQSVGALQTELTTVTSGAGVDIPIGKGIAGSAFSSNAVIVVRDFEDTEDLEARHLQMQQPDVVMREKWRSAIYVPISFPPGTAVFAAYSENVARFSGNEAPMMEVWGERLLLRCRLQRIGSRQVRLARFYDNLLEHVHDIRQYADTVLMNLEGLRDGSRRASLDRAVRAAKDLDALCQRDLRAVAQQEPRNRLCNVTREVHEIVEAMRTRALTGGIRISFSGDANSPGRIDPRELRRAVSNLIANSISQLASVSRREKSIDVKVHASQSYTAVSVKDNGPGIQPDRVPSIFDAGVSYTAGGYGIGLAQVESTMVAIGGLARVTHNDFGRGCSFTLYIPTTRGIKNGANLMDR